MTIPILNHLLVVARGQAQHRCFHQTSVLLKGMGAVDHKLVFSSTKNKVTTLTMNDPKKLNGWSGPMMLTLQDRFLQHAADPDTKVVILTGADPYYCAGVNLASTIQPMHPKKLHTMIRTSNQAVFDSFLDFPKPILIAANGPAIGACVTSASTCDAILASEKATFLVPFAKLSIPPEGCSSVHFERMLGKEAARKMLEDGWKPSAAEAKEIGLVQDVVQHDQLMVRAQELAEQWVAAGKVKEIPAGGSVEEYKAVNAKESLELADAFLSYPFLDAQYNFLKSKGKSATVFMVLKTLRPVWSKLL
eukprot:GFUD01100074.1.p1 GENE.GFUD01100074.1~~GFUD01100074.1.p1  ORF type:complete len:305 (+),score=107.79 GFUD01100074.1:55-969(+)